MENKVVPISAAIGIQAVCLLSIVVSYWISHVVYESSLMSDPVGVLRLFLAVEGPLVIGIYSLLRDDARNCSYWKAVGRGLLGLPVVCAFGSSKKDWQRLLVISKTTEQLDYMISQPAHGAVIGGWIGAWPMPLDWERPWQEWPISVTYGAVAGYFLGLLTSVAFIIGRKSRVKSD